MAEGDERGVREAATSLIETLADFDEDSRLRIIRTALTFYDLPAPAEPSSGGAGMPHAANVAASHVSREATFVNREELPPKDFLFQKQPRTDVERVACVAYYLSHYRDMRHFKTFDISKLNTEAAQVKFSNPAYAVVNAANAGLIVPAGKGFKQLSALGERYVEALPDRAAAKEILTTARPRRNKKSTKSNRLPSN